MNTTEHLGLDLPGDSDWADVDVLNQNFEKLDVAAQAETEAREQAVSAEAAARTQAIAAEAAAREQGLSGKAPMSHTHPAGDITGLDKAMSGKADASHTHTTDQVTGLDAALAGKMPLEAVALEKGTDVLSLAPGRYCIENLTSEEVTAMHLPVVAWHYEITVIATHNISGTTQNYKEVTVDTGYETFKNFLHWDSWLGWKQLTTADQTVSKSGDTMKDWLAVQSSRSDYSPYITADCVPSGTRFAMISGQDGRGSILLQDYPSCETKSGVIFTKGGELDFYNGNWHRLLHDGNFADWFKSSGQSSFTEIRSITTGEAANKVVLPLSDLNWGEWTRIHLALSLGVQTNSYLSGDPSGASYIVPMVNGINANGAWKGTMQVLRDADFFFWMIYGGVQGSDNLLRSGARFREIKSIYFQTTNTNLPIPAGATIKLYGER